jgi:hypothetical protein
MLDPNNGLLPAEMIVRLRTRLNLPADQKPGEAGAASKPAATAEVKP